MTINPMSTLDSLSSARPPGEIARRVMRRVDRAALATARRDGSGWPYPTLVLVALDHDATPLLLISTLAEHTRNLLADDRIGLLFDDTAGLAEPLAGARVSVLGRVRPTKDPRHHARILARHPSTAFYAGFGDFGYYRVEIERAHLIGGFGRTHWIDRAELILGADAVGSLPEEEATLLPQLNSKLIRARSKPLEGCAHIDTEQACLADTAVPERPETDSRWVVTGLDPDGCDLRRSGAIARLDFDAPASSAGAVNAALAALLERHRQ